MGKNNRARRAAKARSRAHDRRPKADQRPPFDADAARDLIFLAAEAQRERDPVAVQCIGTGPSYSNGRAELTVTPGQDATCEVPVVKIATDAPFGSIGAQIQPGPVINPKVKIRAFRPPIGEAYGRIEGPKGELGFYLISDGGPNPYRYRVRPPSFINLTVLEDLCLGHTVADVMVILGSIDIVMGEVDR